MNEQPDLTTLHTLWVREHNRVAGRLQRYCPDWGDQRLFQVTQGVCGTVVIGWGSR